MGVTVFLDWKTQHDGSVSPPKSVCSLSAISVRVPANFFGRYKQAGSKISMDREGHWSSFTDSEKRTVKLEEPHSLGLRPSLKLR